MRSGSRRRKGGSEEQPSRHDGVGHYPPIQDYGYIGDCHSSALVSKSGSVDWCCIPRHDSGSCFGRILDWDKGGFCQIVPSEAYEVSRRYVDEALVLETTFKTESGKARLLDLFPMHRGGAHHPFQQILRRVEGVEGQVRFDVRISPRFDYGACKPWIRKYPGRCHLAIGGDDGLLISSDFNLDISERHDLIASLDVKKRDRNRLSLIYGAPSDLEEGRVHVPGKEELDHRYEETLRWWKRWISRGTFEGSYQGMIRRSALVLKALSYAPTGAIVAAPTTSLPERRQGSRNWDYRYSWIRDSVLAVHSLDELGFSRESDKFLKFVQRSAAGSAEELQVLFGVGGERRLTEYEIKELKGYRDASPVRIGNSAESQRQLDVYGFLLELAWQWHLRGNSPDEDYWEFIVDLLDTTGKIWRNPDRGIWEMRCEPRHFIFSKAMCWVALDRGLKLARELHRNDRIAEWETRQKEIRDWIEEQGYDRRRHVYIQAAGRPEMDASLLLLPIVGFIDFNDPRMVRTADAIRDDLVEDGLLRRYSIGNDGLEGDEGAFIACTFWLAECLARQGRKKEAAKVFKKAVSTRNDLDLFSEEFNPKAKESLGNFPQALSHLSFISAAIALTEAS